MLVAQGGREGYYLCLLKSRKTGWCKAVFCPERARRAARSWVGCAWRGLYRDLATILWAGDGLPGWLGTLFRKRGISALTDPSGRVHLMPGWPAFYRKMPSFETPGAARDMARPELVQSAQSLRW